MSDLCQEMASQHYENFPVGRFVHPQFRADIHGLYAFARSADDFADEERFAGQRSLRLKEWRQKLIDAQAGRFDDAIFAQVAQTLAKRELPARWLHDLLDAFEMDVQQSRHANFDSLLQYSEKSANPVGRSVLWIHGHRDEAMLRWSDCICTALQLTNFWQDVAIDLKKDRIYIPQAELKEAQITEAMLFAHQAGPNYPRMMGGLAQKTSRLFAQGKPLLQQVSGRLALELSMVWQGGTRILRKLDKVNYDVFRYRPKLKVWDWLAMLARALGGLRT